MRALHCGSCSQQKTTTWRLIAVAGSLAVFRDVLATVKETWISRSMVFQKKRSCGVVGYTKYPGKISPRALDTGYVDCISKEAKKPIWTIFLLFFLWQSPIYPSKTTPKPRRKLVLTGPSTSSQEAPPTAISAASSTKETDYSEGGGTQQQTKRLREELQNVLRLTPSRSNECSGHL